jgi:hypothetical protein
MIRLSSLLKLKKKKQKKISARIVNRKRVSGSDEASSAPE